MVKVEIIWQFSIRIKHVHAIFRRDSQKLTEVNVHMYTEKYKSSNSTNWEIKLHRSIMYVHTHIPQFLQNHAISLNPFTLVSLKPQIKFQWFFSDKNMKIIYIVVQVYYLFLTFAFPFKRTYKNRKWPSILWNIQSLNLKWPSSTLGKSLTSFWNLLLWKFWPLKTSFWNISLFGLVKSLKCKKHNFRNLSWLHLKYNVVDRQAKIIICL